ncbi:DUF3905 domain-containing protein [Cohnella nanjingensis]|uniref:DUF3905 domain-containing protein n=1 Tax=Cohnella nanjingensis TaxID=1387779 RepID=A0A7X0RT92_9BACL|nr:DUF3905 domain-containing protein [Cohnella nanjingensis]MBB6673272.1 DUF3905 domain-containing protein [Cohnella nanjingensis]
MTEKRPQRTADNAGYERVVPAPGRDDPTLDPFEIAFRQDFRDNPGPRDPFVNAHGAVIGDHEYESPRSPLEQWSRDTDPAVMAGEQWVHPYRDIGFRTPENRDLFENGILPSPDRFMHPSHRTADPDGWADEDAEGARSAEGAEGYYDYFPVPEVLDEP